MHVNLHYAVSESQLSAFYVLLGQKQYIAVQREGPLICLLALLQCAPQCQ